MINRLFSISFFPSNKSYGGATVSFYIIKFFFTAIKRDFGSGTLSLHTNKTKNKIFVLVHPSMSGAPFIYQMEGLHYCK